MSVALMISYNDVSHLKGSQYCIPVPMPPTSLLAPDPRPSAI